MTDIIGRIEGMLWCNDNLGVPIEMRQVAENCFELSFRTNRLPDTLIAGLSVTIEDSGNVIVDYHGPSVVGTGSKLLGNVLTPEWGKDYSNDE